MYANRYRCTLLKPVVLLADPRTETVSGSLDFIPGSVFRGMVAPELYKMEAGAQVDQQTLDIFHNGQVQFGDAHLVQEGVRTYHMPAVYERGKDDDTNTLYLKTNAGNPPNLKQVKTGYITLRSAQKVIRYEVQTGLRIKSARDAATGSAKEGQLFMYEFLKAGQVFEFEVRAADQAYFSKVEDALLGRRYVGKSRSAEFGVVSIEKIGQGTAIQKAVAVQVPEDGRLMIYAESHWCVLDQYDQFTWTPALQHFGLEKTNGRIDWYDSQLWQGRVSVWNGHRKTRDPERLLIKKGSVLVVTGLTPGEQLTLPPTVGYFLSEGYGRVLYNPEFLMLDKQQPATLYNGEATRVPEVQVDPVPGEQSAGLMTHLKASKRWEDEETLIDQAVNRFKKEGQYAGMRAISASQWGAIYGVTRRVTSYAALVESLFAERNRESARHDGGLLRRGTMAPVWEMGNRIDLLKDFLEGNAVGIHQADRKVDLLAKLSLEMARDKDKQGLSVQAHE